MARVWMREEKKKWSGKLDSYDAHCEAKNKETEEQAYVMTSKRKEQNSTKQPKDQK